MLSTSRIILTMSYWVYDQRDWRCHYSTSFKWASIHLLHSSVGLQSFTPKEECSFCNIALCFAIWASTTVTTSISCSTPLFLASTWPWISWTWAQDRTASKRYSSVPLCSACWERCPFAHLESVLPKKASRAGELLGWLETDSDFQATERIDLKIERSSGCLPWASYCH